MKFQVEREALGEAVPGWRVPFRPGPSSRSCPACSSRRPRGLTLSCFDYEVSARAVIPGEVAEPGTALVPGRLLAEITRSLPQRDVEVARWPTW